MSGNREIILSDQIINKEIVDKIIDLGVPVDIIKQVDFRDLETITSEPMDLQNFYLNIIKIKESKKKSRDIALRTINKLWKILCLTGQLSYIKYAYQLISEDKTLDVCDISPRLQLDYNIIDAMIYTAYTGNIEGLFYLFNNLAYKKLLYTNFDFQKSILFNSVWSNKVETVKWIVTNLSINIRALCIVDNIFFIAAKSI